MMHFDRTRCETLLDALRQHRSEWDEDLQIFSKQPLHDWTSHGADMVRYYAVTRPRYKLTNWDEPALGRFAVNEGATGRRRARG